ncbi:MAG: YndJ family protein [Bacillus sp. (in: Bacteria)]|nr:YndJ family protein [Bacillus sp. (in: firmicutes)]
MTKLIHWQVLLGAATWAALSVFFHLGTIEVLLSFSFLVLVPLSLYLTRTVDLGGNLLQSFSMVLVCHYPFAVAGTFSLVFEPGLLAGVLAVVWLVYTLLLAGYGLVRLLARGWRPMEELLIDAAFIYVVMGGVWLVLHRFAVEGLPFPSVIVLLTAIHFHYSAFLVPIFTGMLGRYVKREKLKFPGFSGVAWGVIAGPMLVAAGINFGGAFEFVMVIIYVIILYWLAIGTVVVMLQGKGSVYGRWLVSLSSVALMVTMALSFLYSYGLTFGNVLLTIPDMVDFHGIGNAFGYGLLGLLGWLLLSVKPRENYYGFPVSRIRGRKYIGSAFIDQAEWRDVTTKVDGLVDNFFDYKGEGFDPALVDEKIHRFYEATPQFRLIAKTTWVSGFRWASRLYHLVTGRVGQLHLEPHRHEARAQEMVGSVIPVLERGDGRKKPRAWVRIDKETEGPIFVAVYSNYWHNGVVYMNIALPLPFSVMTGVLRARNDKSDGLLLTSEKNRDDLGHEGIYLTMANGFTVKLPISETFHVQEVSDGGEDGGRLFAVHRMKFCGIPCLTIEYEIWEE